MKQYRFEFVGLTDSSNPHWVEVIGVVTMFGGRLLPQVQMAAL